MRNEKPKQQANKEIISFYEQLPRFVATQAVETVSNKLQPIERTIELGGREFVFTMIPARVMVDTGNNGEINEQRRFPGDFEEFLESVLRSLAVPENMNFNRAAAQLYCDLDQLRLGMSDFDGVDESDSINNRIEIALATLKRVTYLLTRGTSQFDFRAIERVNRREMGGKVYYQLSFSPFFFGDREEFDLLFGA